MVHSVCWSTNMRIEISTSHYYVRNGGYKHVVGVWDGVSPQWNKANNNILEFKFRFAFIKRLGRYINDM